MSQSSDVENVSPLVVDEVKGDEEPSTIPPPKAATPPPNDIDEEPATSPPAKENENVEVDETRKKVEEAEKQEDAEEVKEVKGDEEPSTIPPPKAATPPPNDIDEEPATSPPAKENENVEVDETRKKVEEAEKQEDAEEVKEVKGDEEPSTIPPPKAAIPPAKENENVEVDETRKKVEEAEKQEDAEEVKEVKGDEEPSTIPPPKAATPPPNDIDEEPATSPSTKENENVKVETNKDDEIAEVKDEGAAAEEAKVKEAEKERRIAELASEMMKCLDDQQYATMARDKYSILKKEKEEFIINLKEEHQKALDKLKTQQLEELQLYEDEVKKYDEEIKEAQQKFNDNGKKHGSLHNEYKFLKFGVVPPPIPVITLDENIPSTPETSYQSMCQKGKKRFARQKTGDTDSQSNVPQAPPSKRSKKKENTEGEEMDYDQFLDDMDFMNHPDVNFRIPPSGKQRNPWDPKIYKIIFNLSIVKDYFNSLEEGAEPPTLRSRNFFKYLVEQHRVPKIETRQHLKNNENNKPRYFHYLKLKEMFFNKYGNEPLNNGKTIMDFYAEEEEDGPKKVGKKEKKTTKK